MSDVRCPYCDNENDICHDDGQGYDEDVDHGQYCSSCGKEFIFTTSISHAYSVYCIGEHDVEQSSIKECNNLYSCTKCDYYEVRD